MIADSLAAGWITSCGLLLVVAGAGKAYASARRRQGGDAIRRVLRLRRARWRAVSAAAAVAECCVGAAVCASPGPLRAYAASSYAVSSYTVPACAAMAALGAMFCALLAYARLRRVQGGCGCLGWGGDRQAVTARSVVRAGLLACAGLLGAVSPAIFHHELRPLPFAAALVAGLAIIAALSTGRIAGLGPRSPACRRPLWRARAVTAAALADSGVFQAMAAAAGPFGPESHRRDGCVDEFVFPRVGGLGQGVLFRVTHTGRRGIAVHATVITGDVAATS
ncbi:MAG TPA: hypothetical protein VK817_22095 [Trebonia sp.]|nr:hypothetical protein [Trebonia sp.]